MKNSYKWIATKGTQYQQTVGFGFFTKKDAVEFSKAQNRQNGSEYIVERVSAVTNPKFI